MPKSSGSGRIVFWRGGILCIGRFEEPISFHSHHAVQIVLPFPGNGARLHQPGGSWESHRAAVVAANQPHAFEARGESVVLIFVEPESREGRALQARVLDAGILAIPHDTVTPGIEALAAAYTGGAPDPELVATARSIIGTLAATRPAGVAPLDRRIERAVELLRSRLGDAVLLAELADAVHLSPDRFRHLFMAETGMRFRPYVLWLRVEIALAAYAAGDSLTDAAQAGGFADSAHLSRTFRRMFGVAPASFRPE